MANIEKINIKTYITESDFREVFGRAPANNEELEEFFYFCEKGFEAQVDWNLIRNSAKEEMENESRCRN